jgi:hypothetical protein
MPQWCGEKNHNWKGEEASYNAKHHWVKRHYGDADHCSLNPTHKSPLFVWHNISGRYKRDITDWEQLCQSCHLLGHLRVPYCVNGHEYNESNTYMYKSGKRKCKKCFAIYQKEYRERLKILGVMICQKTLLDHGLLIRTF